MWGKWENLKEIFAHCMRLQQIFVCSPWLLSTIKRTDIKQRAELSERTFGNVATRNEMFKYLHNVWSWVPFLCCGIWGSEGKERQSLHCFLLFHVISCPCYFTFYLNIQRNCFPLSPGKRRQYRGIKHNTGAQDLTWVIFPVSSSSLIWGHTKYNYG